MRAVEAEDRLYKIRSGMRYTAGVLNSEALRHVASCVPNSDKMEDCALQQGEMSDDTCLASFLLLFVRHLLISFPTSPFNHHFSAFSTFI